MNHISDIFFKKRLWLGSNTSPHTQKKQQQPQQEYNKVGDVINKNYRLTNLFLVPFAGVAYSLSDV